MTFQIQAQDPDSGEWEDVGNPHPTRYQARRSAFGYIANAELLGYTPEIYYIGEVPVTDENREPLLTKPSRTMHRHPGVGLSGVCRKCCRAIMDGHLLTCPTLRLSPGFSFSRDKEPDD